MVMSAGTRSTSTPADGSITLAKMANLATDKIIGRVTNSTGVPEAVTFTDQAQALCDDTSFATMRNTLGLDTFDLAVAIDNPTARTYTIARKFSQAWTLVNITAGTDQGTLTLNVRKSGTSVTSLSAVSVSSTYGDTSATANNAFTTTDYLDFVLSSVSGSPNELVVTIHYTR